VDNGVVTLFPTLKSSILIRLSNDLQIYKLLLGSGEIIEACKALGTNHLIDGKTGLLATPSAGTVTRSFNRSERRQDDGAQISTRINFI